MELENCYWATRADGGWPDMGSKGALSTTPMDWREV